MLVLRHFISASLIAVGIAGCAAPRSAPTSFNRALNPVNAQNTTFQRFSNAQWFDNLPYQQQKYYQSAQGKQGEALFTSLHQIIQKGQRALSYGGARSFMYGNADQVQVGNKTGLIASYSNILIPGSGSNGNRYREAGDMNNDGQSGDFINCEHTWPQSFFGKRSPMVSDMHHLFPTLSKPNGMRNNHPVGMANGVIVYETSGGAKLGVIDKTGRHNPQDIKSWYNMPWNQQPHDIMRRDLQAVFEPPNEQKGNTARAMLYFYLRYYNENIRQGAFKEDVYWDQQVKTYIQWAKADPVDENERRRHDAVAGQQNNRNPFVDIPDLASIIGEQVLTEAF